MIAALALALLLCFWLLCAFALAVAVYADIEE